MTETSDWLTHPLSSTLHLASGYTCQVNRVRDHGGLERWRARALGQPVDGEWGTRREAEVAAFLEARRRAAAVLLAVGWPDDATISKTLAVWYQDDNWQEALSPYVNKTMDEMRAALVAALKGACND